MRSLLLAAACRSASPGVPPSWAAPDPVSEAPPIAEALGDLCPEPLPEEPNGLGLHRVTLHDAPSRCNDGSPPLLFVRQALDSARSDEWVIHLDGGSSCSDYETCTARWCGDGVYSASDMSSRFAPETLRAGGILGATYESTFGGVNIAEIYYCSSDFWLGTRPTQLAAGGDGPEYTLYFEGDLILSDAIEALAAGLTSDDGTQTLPSLDAAKEIVFSGSSAGAFGAVLQINEIARRSPGVNLTGAIDAAISPTLSTLSPADAALLQAQIEAQWRSPGVDTWGAAVDVACAEQTPEEDLWRCFDIDQVIREYIDLPIAYHHDLYDPVIGDFFEAAGLSREPFVEASIATLRGYADNPMVSVHASACGVHMSLVRDVDFLLMPVSDALSGAPFANMHEIVRTAATGGQIVAIDDASGQGSICP